MALSRRIGSSPFGKRSEELRTHTDFATKEALRAKAAANGMSENEFLEFIVQVNVFGLDHVVSLHRRRLEAAAENGQE